MQILDALQVYTIRADDPPRSHVLELAWSNGGKRSYLNLDGYVEAVFDFDGCRGCCRSGFPPGPFHTGWSHEGHAWDEDMAGGEG